jgi:hypothetical protein
LTQATSRITATIDAVCTVANNARRETTIKNAISDMVTAAVKKIFA